MIDIKLSNHKIDYPTIKDIKDIKAISQVDTNLLDIILSRVNHARHEVLTNVIKQLLHKRNITPDDFARVTTIYKNTKFGDIIIKFDNIVIGTIVITTEGYTHILTFKPKL